MQILIRIFVQICTKLRFSRAVIRIFVQICTKLRLKYVFILRGEMVYTVTGQEVE